MVLLPPHAFVPSCSGLKVRASAQFMFMRLPHHPRKSRLMCLVCASLAVMHELLYLHKASASASVQCMSQSICRMPESVYLYSA